MVSPTNREDVAASLAAVIGTIISGRCPTPRAPRGKFHRRVKGITMFDGFHSYETVLMVLGIVMFVMLAIVLIFGNNVVSVETNLAKLAENPGDTKTRAQLMESLERVAERPTSDPNENLTLALAYKTLGQPERALARVDSALKVNPRLREAARLREDLRR